MITQINNNNDYPQMKGKPTVVTPTGTVGTPNPFAALAEAENTTDPADATPEIPNNKALEIPKAPPALGISKDKYLPNQVAPEPQSTGEPGTPLIIDDLSLSSISTMSSLDNTEEFSKAKISALMERIQTNITKEIKAYTYTDIANF